MRPRFEWNLGRRRLALGERTLVMGIVNVTPDSFSDGGQFFSPEQAVAHGLRLLDEGADILDIGGESTRPGAATTATTAPVLAGAVRAEEEMARVLPVIEGLRRQRPEAILSIDTYKSAVARAAVRAGADIVNDVSGFTWDAEMASTLASLGCGAILMHVRGLPHQWATLPPEADPTPLVFGELATLAGRAFDAGIAHSRIVLDPGFGFGKRLDENYPLLARLGELHALGYPLLVAISRKSCLGHTLMQRLRLETPPGPSLRDTATLATSVAAALAGAHIVRVHAVRQTIEALAIADAIVRAGEPAP
jgi:dihydropteroate synthase